MTLIRNGVLGLLLLGSSALASSSEEKVWEALSGPFRRQPLDAREGAGRTAITIEAGGRANPFMIPSGAGALPGSPGKKGRGGKAAGREVSAKDVRRVLDDFAARIEKAEKAFEQGRYGELPSVKDVKGWEAAVGKLSSDKPEEMDLKGALLQRAGGLAARMEARETFLARGYTVHFVVVNEAFPERSVASVGGKLVRTGESFDDGVTAQEIRREGILVTYKGLKFALPISRTER